MTDLPTILLCFLAACIGGMVACIFFRATGRGEAEVLTVHWTVGPETPLPGNHQPKDPSPCSASPAASAAK